MIVLELVLVLDVSQAGQVSAAWFYGNTFFSITTPLHSCHQKIEDEDEDEFEEDKNCGNLTGLLLAARRLKIADYFAKLLRNQ